MGPSSYFCKHPPLQYTDNVANKMTQDFIDGETAHAEEVEKFLAKFSKDAVEA